jgi:oxygen-independent coproporphyrinogen-3 oxidase
MLNALRLREGFALEDYASRTGLPLSSIDRGVEAALAKGLLSAERDGIGRLVRVQPTDRGFDFLSDLQQLFLPATRAVGLRRGS